MPNNRATKISGSEKSSRWKPTSSFGVDVEAIDLLQRMKYGNCFEERKLTLESFKREVTVKQRDPNSEFSYERSKSITAFKASESETESALEIEVGKLEIGLDGFGVSASATVFSGKITEGPLDIGATVGQVSGTAKLWDEDGLDVVFDVSASLLKLKFGPITYEFGFSVDFGLKIGDNGFGFKFNGYGFEVGENRFRILFPYHETISKLFQDLIFVFLPYGVKILQSQSVKLVSSSSKMVSSSSKVVSPSTLSERLIKYFFLSAISAGRYPKNAIRYTFSSLFPQNTMPNKMPWLNPYKILGVTEKSTEKEIKDAYYKLSVLHHHYNNGDGNDAQMRDIDWAYKILLDPNDRKMYNSDGL